MSDLYEPMEATYSSELIRPEPTPPPMTPSHNGVPVDSYFDSPDFSDITLVYKACRIFAHKIILARGSAYFKREFARHAKLGQTGELFLDADHPLALRAVIAWLYGLVCDYNGQFSNKRGALPSGPADLWGAANYAKWLVSLYATAKAYEVEDLANRAKDRIPTIISTVTDFEGKITHLTVVAEHVYLRHREMAAELRPPIVRVIVNDIDRFSGLRQFDLMMLAIPELAAEVVKALAAKAKRSSLEAQVKLTLIYNGSNKRKAETQAGQVTIAPSLRAVAAPQPLYGTPNPYTANALSPSPPNRKIVVHLPKVTDESASFTAGNKLRNMPPLTPLVGIARPSSVWHRQNLR
ncbi:hypothetical protein LTR08_006843 [Meristemomyces frigidus]|nr:hypothetical protein LTR08_006843 [Meristemomyces frigidus]